MTPPVLGRHKYPHTMERIARRSPQAEVSSESIQLAGYLSFALGDLGPHAVTEQRGCPVAVADGQAAGGQGPLSTAAVPA